MKQDLSKLVQKLCKTYKINVVIDYNKIGENEEALVTLLSAIPIDQYKYWESLDLVFKNKDSELKSNLEFILKNMSREESFRAQKKLLKISNDRKENAITEKDILTLAEEYGIDLGDRIILSEKIFLDHKETIKGKRGRPRK